MGLKGQLEDLPLIDMLQIIAFSQKSGYLRVSGPAGRGAVVLREGRLLFAFSWSSIERIREMAKDPENITTDAKRANIEAALRELAGLREGSFKFELTTEISDELGGVKISPFMIVEGLDPQELLLDLAVEIDNERREATSLVELAFQGDLPAEANELPDDEDGLEVDLPPEPPPAPEVAPVKIVEVVEPVEPVESAVPAVDGPGDTFAETPVAPERYTVVVVDDERPVIEVVGRELQAKGYRVFTASGPGAGADVVRARVTSGDSVLAVVDLKMPTSSGRSFYGGFELVRRLARNHTELPVLLMVEGLTEKVRARARTLGIRRIVYKPTLTKPDPDLYRADLREFSATVEAQLRKLIEDQGPSAAVATQGNGSGNDAGRMHFLASMTKKLVEPGGSTDVSRLVLQVAAQFLERGLLFVVKSESVRGLAGYGFGRSATECAKVAQEIIVDIGTLSALTEAVSTGTTHRVRDGLECFEGPLFDAIGKGRASEAVLMPVQYNRATLLLLYGDNGVSGKALGDLGGLELFMAQAGMALENKLLQRKLSGGETPEPERGDGVIA